MFGERFYIEIQRHGLPRARRLSPSSCVGLMTMACRSSPPTNLEPRCFRRPRRASLHRGGALRRGRRPAPALAPTPQSEMADLFADLPEAIENTVDRQALRLSAGSARTDPARLRSRRGRHPSRRSRRTEGTGGSGAGMARRLAAIPGHLRGASEEDYKKRLAFELDVITRIVPGYFLIVSDFIKMDEGARHPRGAGPQMGAGSVVARLPISTPCAWLLFERFQPRARLDAGLRHRLLPGPVTR